MKGKATAEDDEEDNIDDTTNNPNKTVAEVDNEEPVSSDEEANNASNVVVGEDDREGGIIYNVAVDEVLNDNNSRKRSLTDHESENESSQDTGARAAVNVPSDRVRALEEELSRKKAKNKILRRLVKKTVPANCADGICIGGNVTIPKHLADSLDSIQKGNAAVFFRRLIFEGGVFTLEEIASSSITGANSINSPPLTRPDLCPTRFNILKEYTIKCCKLREKSVEIEIFNRKIGNTCGDGRRRWKRTMEKL